MRKWGELWEQSLRTIFTEAAIDALDDAGVDRIDSMYIGCMSGGLFVGQEHLGSMLADYLGQRSLPATRVESACASGGLAVKSAYYEIASGASDVVLAAGVEKMTDVDGNASTYALATASDQEYEAYHGVTFPGLYAMIAHAHMKKYGTTKEQLAQVAVKNHANGSRNPLAQYPYKVDVKTVLESTLIADPLHILDCSPITDGAAAVLLASMDVAKKLAKGRPIVRIAGVGHSTDTIALHARKDLTFLEATQHAARKAYDMAKCGPGELDLVELHDCFTIAEICVIEALGLCERGQGGKAIDQKLTTADGKIPVNVSGGLKSKGHPVGATGVAQILEVAKHLRGEAGERQVKGARRGLTQNMGGTGGSSIVHILEVC